MPKRKDLKKIMIIGSGPIIIGQACEFDYSGAQACKVLKEEGYEVVLVNSNPATIMTDPEFADKTYIEPLSTEFVAKIIERERPDAILPTLGGQTGLNIAVMLARQGSNEFDWTLCSAKRICTQPFGSTGFCRKAKISSCGQAKFYAWRPRGRCSI